MTITTDTEDAFRIPHQGKAAPEQHTNMMDDSTWTDAAESARTARVVSGGPQVEEQWVSTLFSDFHTLTFRPVVELFHTAVADPAQTAFLVGRLACVAPGPEFFRFTPAALRVLREENAGGASEFSEALSFEYFHRVFGAELLKTEMAIGYTWGRWSKKTDYSCVLPCGTRLAVSVTRAMRFAGVFSEDDALRLLSKKLYGCQMSNRDVVAEDRWNKQVLHIFTETVAAVELLRRTFTQLLVQRPELVGDTVVLITLTQNAPFVYFNFCAEQGNMCFVAPCTELVHPLQQQLFTTAAAIPDAASTEEAEDDTLRVLLAAKAPGKEFYPTREEEDSWGLSAIWMEGEEFEQALEALAALPYACGGDEASEEKPAIADKENAEAYICVKEGEEKEGACISGTSSPLFAPRPRAAARRRWRSPRKVQHWQPRRRVIGNGKPCWRSLEKAKWQRSLGLGIKGAASDPDRYRLPRAPAGERTTSDTKADPSSCAALVSDHARFCAVPLACPAQQNDKLEHFSSLIFAMAPPAAAFRPSLSYRGAARRSRRQVDPRCRAQRSRRVQRIFEEVQAQ